MESQDIAKFVIKVCGITTAEDAEHAARAGATALGFIFYPKSPRYVLPARAEEIARSLPGGVLKVGVFVNATRQELAAVSNTVPLDILQLHGDVSSSPPIARIWRSVAVDNHFSLTELSDSYEAYLLDSPGQCFGGSGRTFDWSVASDQTSKVRLIVAGGLDASNVAEAIDATHPWGVDACSRLESQPGQKDRAKVQAFVEAARDAFERMSNGKPADLAKG
jgi:phosphoribosylanthranilate isomerase